MPLNDVLREALGHETPLIELTGGEPLLQAEVLPLMKSLCDAGKTVLLETSGERDIGGVDPRVHRIVDLKAPGSGESERNRWENIELLTTKDEVKFVLADRKDYEWARDVIAERGLGEIVGAVLMGCVWGELEPKTLVEWVLQDKLNVRVQLQQHKYIWGGDVEGV